MPTIGSHRIKVDSQRPKIDFQKPKTDFQSQKIESYRPKIDSRGQKSATTCPKLTHRDPKLRPIFRLFWGQFSDVLKTRWDLPYTKIFTYDFFSSPEQRTFVLYFLTADCALLSYLNFPKFKLNLTITFDLKASTVLETIFGIRQSCS